MKVNTSIIPGMSLAFLLLLARNVNARHFRSPDDDSALRPILSKSDQTRICSELCTSGLGGTPCGDSCFDLMPSIPVAADSQDGNSQNAASDARNSKKYNVTTRKDSCDVLCQNNLGYPLCSCTYDDRKLYATDFVEVCSTFCLKYEYQLFGCQNCKVYSQYYNKTKESSPFDFANLNMGTVLSVSWAAWCRDACSDGNGGAACKCDLLP